MKLPVIFAALALSAGAYVNRAFLDPRLGAVSNALLYTKCADIAEGTPVSCETASAVDVVAARPYVSSPAYGGRHLCPESPPQSHLGLLFDPTVAALVTAALDEEGPLPPAFEPSCP